MCFVPDWTQQPGPYDRPRKRRQRDPDEAYEQERDDKATENES